MIIKIVILFSLLFLLVNCQVRDSISPKSENEDFMIMFFASEDWDDPQFGKSNLYLMDSEGSNLQILHEFSREIRWEMEISTNGSKVLIGAISVINSDGSDYRTIYNGVGNTAAKWRPTSEEEIVFVEHVQNKEIFFRKIWDLNKIRLTNNNVNDYDPVWSSNGNKIYFTRDGNIWVMNYDGSGQEVFLDTSFFIKELQFNYDYTLFSCMGWDTSFGSNNFISTVENPFLDPLDPIGPSDHLEWSPKSNNIAFRSLPGEISLFNYSSKSISLIKSLPPGFIYEDLRWSPNSQKLIARIQTIPENKYGLEIIDLASKKSQILIDYDDFVYLSTFICVPVTN